MIKALSLPRGQTYWMEDHFRLGTESQLSSATADDQSSKRSEDERPFISAIAKDRTTDLSTIESGSRKPKVIRRANGAPSATAEEKVIKNSDVKPKASDVESKKLEKTIEFKLETHPQRRKQK